MTNTRIYLVLNKHDIQQALELFRNEEKAHQFGGAVRNATPLIPQRLSSIILTITCSENVHARPCIESHGRVDRDNNTTFTISEQVITSIIEDSRCGMSDVAFRTAPPLGGLSCFHLHVLVVNIISENFVVVVAKMQLFTFICIELHLPVP